MQTGRPPTTMDTEIEAGAGAEAEAEAEAQTQTQTQQPGTPPPAAPAPVEAEPPAAPADRPRSYLLIAAADDGEAGGRFAVSREAACQSELLRNIVERSESESESDSDREEGAGVEEIPLPNVKARELARVVEFCEHHVDHELKEIPKPLPDGNFDQYVTEWDAEFVRRIANHEELFELIEAAHYMDLRGLMELGAAKVASMIRGKTPEEIRELFGIENDFTPEEEAQIREENRWCEEI